MSLIYLQVISKVAETQSKLEKMGFARFPIDTEIKKLGRGKAGTAHLRTNKISISQDYLKEFPERILNITVPHEVVHHYVAKYYPRAKQYHGREFKGIMRALGLAGDTYHSMILENAPPRQVRTKKRFIYVTERTGVELKLTSQQHNKIKAGRTLTYKGEKLVDTKIVLEVM
jgi:predicted SprT family Zn-dependent metalloprotease